MQNRLKGKVAIVAGAGSTGGDGLGNGKASAVVYAREGASVMLVDLNLEAAEKTRKMIEQEGGTCFAFQANVSQRSDCEAMVRECLNRYGQIDVLHNNVGVEPKTFGGVLDTDDAEWDRVINVNLKSVFITSSVVLPSMLERGSGSILNISSVSAERLSLGLFLYCISKAGVNTLTKAMALDYADKGIRVNAIMPGLMDTPMVERHKEFYGGDREKMRQLRNERAPMKRMGEAWDVANAALFLVSDEAKYITGQVLAVDGGYLCKP